MPLDLLIDVTKDQNHNHKSHTSIMCSNKINITSQVQIHKLRITYND